MRWFMLAVLFTARLAMAFQFQTIGASGPLLVRDLGFSYADIGTLIGLYLLPGLAIALPGGMLGQRFGSKVVLGGLLMMAIGGVITGVGTGLGDIAIGRLISGTGGVLLNVLLAKMVADWFSGKSLTAAMGLLVTSWPLGVGSGLAGGHAIVAHFGWPALMFTGAALALGALVLVASTYREPPGAPAVTSGVRTPLTGHEWRMTFVAGGIWTAYNVAFIVLISFAPEFFVAHGYTSAQGSLVVSLLGWLLMPAIVAGGVLCGQIGRPNLLMVTGFAVAALATLAATVAPPLVAIALFIVISLAAGLPAGAIMALPVEVLRPQSRATGMGVFFACYYAGMALLPAYAGSLRDHAGTATAPVLFAAAMMAAALLLLGLFRALQQAATSPTTALPHHTKA